MLMPASTQAITHSKMEEVGGVAHTMGHEGQRPGAERPRKQVERRTEELLRGRW